MAYDHLPDVKEQPNLNFLQNEVVGSMTADKIIQNERHNDYKVSGCKLTKCDQLRLKSHSNGLKVHSKRPRIAVHAALPAKSILKPERSSHAGPSSVSPPASTPAASMFLTSDDEDDIVVRVAITSLRKRAKRSKQRLAAAKKEISDLKLEGAEASRQLQEVNLQIEQLKEAKKTAEDRWMTYKGQFKKVLQTSKDANNRIAYLEKLLALEEKSGFSTRVSETQLH